MSKLLYDEIKYTVQDIVQASNPADLVEGTVVSTNPIKVEIDGNSELYPSSTFLIPHYLSNPEFDVEFTGYRTTYTRDDYVDPVIVEEPIKYHGKLKLNTELKVGDPVYILKCQNGQRAFILDRKV